MTRSPNPSEDNGGADRLTTEQRKLLEEIASWDEEEYPLAKHARQILESTGHEGSS